MKFIGGTGRGTRPPEEAIGPKMEAKGLKKGLKDLKQPTARASL